MICDLSICPQLNMYRNVPRFPKYLIYIRATWSVVELERTLQTQEWVHEVASSTSDDSQVTG